MLSSDAGRFFLVTSKKRTYHLLAQHDLAAVVMWLLPLVRFISGKSCEEGTSAVVKLLGEALEVQEAASKRAGELKNLKPKSLMALFAAESGKVKVHVVSAEKVQSQRAPIFSYVSTGRIDRSVDAPESPNNKKIKVKPVEKEEEHRQSAARRTRKRTKRAEEADKQKLEEGNLKKHK